MGNANSLTLVSFEGPQLERKLLLNFQGDWGQANFHVVCGWLSQTICDRAGAGSRVAIWNGCGGADSLRAVSQGEMDLAIATPAAFARMAISGEGSFAGEPQPRLRALGVLPQDDRLIFAVKRDLGISTIAQLREEKPPLNLALSIDDGNNNIGYLSRKWLEASGLSLLEIAGWGGKVYQAQRPETCLELMANGSVDAVVQEAIMAPWWHEHLTDIPLQFLEIEEDVLQTLEKETGINRGVVPAGFFPGLERDLLALDFSNFLVVVRDDMPNDVAHLISWCLTETKSELEARYLHLPPQRSPITYPLDPYEMAKTSIPLHPGAKQHYLEQGYIT